MVINKKDLENIFLDFGVHVAEKSEIFTHDWTGKNTGNPLLVLQPDTSQKVSFILETCHFKNIRVQIQGGNTGLVGGSVPDDTGTQVLINMNKLNSVREINPFCGTITVDAGQTVIEVQKLAEENNLYFPLSLASEGSCQIGGAVATNAGGIHVVRYGMMRDLVLGLEVVLPDGRIWGGLSSLLKDNTGYDLKQMFIGSEGSLGVITAVTLKLFPINAHKEVFLLALPSIDVAPNMLCDLKNAFGSSLQACEIFSGEGLERVLECFPDCKKPMTENHPWFLLVELGVVNEALLPREYVEKSIYDFIEQEKCVDAIFASSYRQQKDIWALRENLTEAEKETGPSIKHDISVDVFDIPKTIKELSTKVNEIQPGIRANIFGHIGDGNLHFNFISPVGMSKAEFSKISPSISNFVYEFVCSIGGSISAEHGIGKAKKEAFIRMKTPLEIELQKSLKKAVDPNNLVGRFFTD